ncbi:HNH endonuclease, partial [Klosneuvirus KNV1]
KYCIVTNSHSDMCEACHIIPYCDCDDNNKYDVNNGILLEAGLHKLFDKYLWSINPNTNKIEVSKQLLNDNSYDLINKHYGKVLNFNNNMKNNLITHYNKFKINQK